MPTMPTFQAAPTLRERFTLAVTVEQLLWVAGLYWAMAANRLFLGAALRGRAVADPGSWALAAALALALVALHVLLLAPLAHRRTVKPLLALLIVATALASYFMQSFHVYLDPSMVRNVLHTDPAEARELLSWTLVLHLVLYAGLPLALLARVRIVQRPWPRALGRRLAHMLLAAALLVGALLSVFQPLASLMRNDKALRYLVTPGNMLWSLGAVLAQDARGAAAPRQTVGADATAGAVSAHRRRPLVVVLVVGETARAANWGLDGYARPTTPELARLPLVNFTDVQSCGTNTEVSVPCMFSATGRHDYDEALIRGSESMLHVAARAGVGVWWRDNQSGCKGVCDGLPSEDVISLNPPGLCAEGRCLDEGLLVGLDQRLARAEGTQLWVLHMLGNHGPSYFRRYPPAFARFQPACESDDLQQCSREQIVNAYDNALRYSDHVLASLVAKLQAQAERVDTLLIYVSDHGESLGEHGLFLHGLPYAIAPDEQTRVPMFMWFSRGAPDAMGLDLGCLRQRAQAPATHDHLFHTVLGLLDVRSQVIDERWDLSADCRAATMAGGR